jgi:Flp pilus assembly protein TadD
MRPCQLCVALFCVLAISACGETGTLGGRTGEGAFAPAGVARSGEAVDGLIVGHRLMAAGEYELALKAYYRAAADKGLNADVLSAIGSATLRLGRVHQAEGLLRQAIEQDETFVPAWNNLGVALISQGKTAEARNVFQTAYALDSGNSDEIRDNLRLAIAKLEQPAYSPAEENNTFQLVRRGNGRFLLLSTPL